MTAFQSLPHSKRRAMLAGAGVGATALLAALVAGCGGTTNNASIGTTQSQSDVVFGINATAFELTGSGSYELSGVGSSSNAAVEYVTGATASTAVVPSNIQGSTGTIPLGFAANAAGGDSVTTMIPLAPAQTGVVFRAALTNGTSGQTIYTVNPSGVTLTSSEVSGFSEPLSFTGSIAGPLGNGTYGTGAFTLPFATFGLHSLTVSASDSKPETTSTTFDVLVLDGATGAAYVSLTNGAGNGEVPTYPAGTPVTITGEVTPVAPATAQTTTDGLGSAILFAAPGTQTVTISPAGATPITEVVTITAGKITIVNGPAASTSTGRRR